MVLFSIACALLAWWQFSRLEEAKERVDRVVRNWDADPVPAEASCSTSAPFAGMAGDGHALKLNPQGVAGVAQALANLYFATCHGETGNDAELARKYGYDIR